MMKPVRRATVGIAVACAIGAALVAPISVGAAERHEGRHHDHDYDRMRHERREHPPIRGYVMQPAPVYAPPVVYAPPPPQAPGFTIVFPIHFH